MEKSGFKVEIPTDELLTLSGGDYPIRFNHSEVTQGKDALLEMLFGYRAIPEGAPSAAISIFESRLNFSLLNNYTASEVFRLAMIIGWAKGGRNGVLEEFQKLVDRGIEKDEEQIKFWKQPDAQLKPLIEICIYGGNFYLQMVAEEVISVAVALAAGGIIEREKPTPTQLDFEFIQSVLRETKQAKKDWEWSDEEFYGFADFPGWEKALQEEVED